MSVVLSVIGTVLSVLLKIILVLLLLLFFLLLCPICYKGEADFHKEVTAKGRVYWLCGLLYISFAYRDGSFGSKIRFFGIDVQRIFAGLAKKRNQRATAKKRKHPKKKPQKQYPVEEPVRQQERKLDETVGDLNDSNREKESRVKDREVYEVERILEKDSEEEVEAFWHRLPFYLFWKKLVKFCQAVRQFYSSMRSIFQKIRKKVEWFGEAKIFWYSENTQRMVCILKDNVLHLWRKLKPKVFRGNIVFGTGDPCLTGQILGLAAIFYASCGRGIQVTPDFEEKRLEGHLMIRGRISLITIGMILIRIFLRGEWSRFRREAEQLMKEAL
jgi:hypothetical protein